MAANPILNRLEWVPWLLTGIFWGYIGLEYYFSEFAVTNKRVMMREGFFNRHSNEIRLSSVSQVNIDQGLIAQMVGYGRVQINAFGALDVYSMIAKPYGFQKAVNNQIDKLQ